MNSRSLLAELKRRNVYRVAVAYAIAAWLLIQISSILLVTTFQAPPWVMKALVTFLALGFPVTLVWAWAFEITPDGVKRTEDVAPATTRGTGRKIVSITVVLAAIATGLFVFRQLRPRPENSVNELERTSLPHLAVVEKGIAVLPFANLSDDKANAYFADGIQDEILTKLSHIADLKVISRTSTTKIRVSRRT